MERAMIVFLMIANLLICPLRCAGQCEATCEPAPAGCGCCAVDVCDSVPEPPTPPDEDCGCPNCICEGALVQLKVQLPEPAWKVIWFGWRSVTPSVVEKVTIHFLSHADRANRLFSSARSAQIALQSWQI
jgi:hypothetical protein